MAAAWRPVWRPTMRRRYSPVGERALGRGTDRLVGGDIEQLPAPRGGAIAAAHVQRCEDACDGVLVADGDRMLAVSTDRRHVVVVVAGAHHRSAEGQADEVEPGPTAPGAGQPERRERAPEQARRILERVVPHAEPSEDIDTSAVDDDVGAAHEATEQVRARFGREVQRDAALGSVARREGEAAIDARLVANERSAVAAPGACARLDAHDLDACIGEEFAGHLAEVANLDGAEALEGSGAIDRRGRRDLRRLARGHTAASPIISASSSEVNPSRSISTSAVCSPTSGAPWSMRQRASENVTG